jgi:DinB superfamily
MTPRAEELAIRLQAQTEAMERSFREIQGSDRQRPITASQDPRGSPWSATDHLAHVVQSEWGLLAIGQRLVANDPDPVRLARRGNTPEERTAFVNSENQAQVQSRRGHSFEELLDELGKVCEQRIQLLDGLSDDQLARPVPGSQQVDLLWAALLGSTRHAETHLEIVQRALAEARA